LRGNGKDIVVINGNHDLTFVNDGNNLIVVDNGNDDHTVIEDEQIVYIINNGDDNSFSPKNWQVLS